MISARTCKTGAFDTLVACCGAACFSLLLPFGSIGAEARTALPALELRHNHTVITQSCLVVIPQGTVFSGASEEGAIEIGAAGITIEFAKGSVLRGSPPQTAPDQYRGYGITLNGHRGVTIRQAKITGFWCGLWATNCDDLTLDHIDASDNRRAHLKSTPVAEDESDWLFGHDNDQKEWLTRYAAAMYVERSSGVTVKNSRVWHGQNALCLDRVTGSKIYDNDFSFNSGWGIAMWRCSSNIISRNALDFCIRGYSHGVYNRGQDSAGIFAFEQNNGNIFVENSVTHGGDGFFGFAGREALGEVGEHPVEWYEGRGNSDNFLVRNDFSYAAAHGIENTFSFGNRYLENRIVGNAICGIWAGYSRQTLIARNDIELNGQMGYGLERGGINIDHGGNNIIVHNHFATNQCGVHLWGGANPDFEKKKWAKANGYASVGSSIAANVFNGDLIAFQFRGPGEVTLGSNLLSGVVTETLDDPAYFIRHDTRMRSHPPDTPTFDIPGVTHPVGARPELRGRENIIMTDWGPWDHRSPLARLVTSSGASALYQVLKVTSRDVKIEIHGTDVSANLHAVPGHPDQSNIEVQANRPGVRPFQLKITAGNKPLAEFAGTLLAAQWQVTFFKWPADIDPRKNLEAYHALPNGPTAVSEVLNSLSFKYGMRGPSDLQLSQKITAAKLGRDHFAMIAKTRLPLEAGTWQVSTESDDGVRVSVDGKPVIENWTWHGPTRDTGAVELESPRTVEIVVEHFQIDGYAVLDFSLDRAKKDETKPK